MHKFTFTIIICTSLILVGCEEKSDEKKYRCSDYKTITDKKIKEELEKKCPAVVGTENIKKSNSYKNSDMLLNELPE